MLDGDDGGYSLQSEWLNGKVEHLLKCHHFCVSDMGSSETHYFMAILMEKAMITINNWDTGFSDPHGTGVPLPATPDVGGRTGPLSSLLWSVDLWRKEFLRHQVGMGRIWARRAWASALFRWFFVEDYEDLPWQQEVLRVVQRIHNRTDRWQWVSSQNQGLDPYSNDFCCSIPLGFEA